jgi:uncharacterized membrane protein
MSKKVSDFGDAIEIAHQEFIPPFQALQNALQNREKGEQIQAKIDVLHPKAVRFFNLFERLLNECDLNNEEDKQEQINASINVANTLADYWRLLHVSIHSQKKYKINNPIVSQNAYTGIQRFIRINAPKNVPALRKKFIEAEIPTHGFDAEKKNEDMTDKNGSEKTETPSNWAKIYQFFTNKGVLVAVVIVVIFIGGLALFLFKDKIWQKIDKSSGLPSQETQNTQKVTISGQLIDKKTDKAITNVTVFLEDEPFIKNEKIIEGLFVLEDISLPSNKIVTLMIQDKTGKNKKAKMLDLTNKSIKELRIELGLIYIE